MWQLGAGERDHRLGLQLPALRKIGHQVAGDLLAHPGDQAEHGAQRHLASPQPGPVLAQRPTVGVRLDDPHPGRADHQMVDVAGGVRERAVV